MLSKRTFHFDTHSERLQSSPSVVPDTGYLQCPFLYGSLARPNCEPRSTSPRVTMHRLAEVLCPVLAVSPQAADLLLPSPARSSPPARHRAAAFPMALHSGTTTSEPGQFPYSLGKFVKIRGPSVTAAGTCSGGFMRVQWKTGCLLTDTWSPTVRHGRTCPYCYFHYDEHFLPCQKVFRCYP